MPIVYENPLPSMVKFHESKARVKVLWGPVGTGKTTGALWEYILQCLESDIPLDGMAIRSSYRELRDSTIKTFNKWFGDVSEWREGDSMALIRLPKASDPRVTLEHILRFRSLQKADDVKKVQSFEGAFVMLDEVVPTFGGSLRASEGIPIEVVEITNSRLRHEFKGVHAHRYTQVIVANPPTPSHWLYKHFLSKDPTELAKRRHGVSVHFIPRKENVQNLPPDYYEVLCDAFHDPDLVRRLVEGEIVHVWSGEAVFPEAKDKVHITSERIEPVKGVPLILGWDYGLCYSDDTEVLTAGGWKSFKDVDAKTDLAASRNPATGEMQYVPINFKVDEPYKGEMLEWKSTEVNFCVTPEHRVPFTYRDTPEEVHFAEARWLADHSGGHHYVDLVSTWAGDEDPFRELQQRQPVFSGWSAGAYAAFMGIYLSEGSTDGDRVVIAQLAPEPRIAAILQATGLPWREQRGREGFSGWRVKHPALAEYLKSYGRAHDKYVPTEIRALGTSAIGAFIDAYTLGDGHVRTRDNGAVEHTVYTVSRRMADDLQELAQKVGWNSSCRWVAPQQSVIVEGNTARTITGGGGYNLTFKKRASRAELLAKNFRRVQYDGRIYCLNVPWHTLYVRRGGKPSWNGNTPGTLITQIAPSGQWRWLSEVQNFNASFDTHLEMVRNHLHDHYPGWELRHWGDPAGATRSQTDEKTCVEMAVTAGYQIKPGRQDWQSRKEAMKQRLLRSAANGTSGLYVSRSGCPLAAEGLTGAYRYPKSSSGEIGTRPLKNHVSHLMDCAQYIATREFEINPAAFVQRPGEFVPQAPPPPPDPFRALAKKTGATSTWLSRY